MKKYREKIAVIIGIISFCMLYLILVQFFEYLEIPVIEYFNEPREICRNRYDCEVSDSDITFLGTYLGFVSTMIALGIYRLISEGELRFRSIRNDSFREKYIFGIELPAYYDWLAWLFGVSAAYIMIELLDYIVVYLFTGSNKFINSIVTIFFLIITLFLLTRIADYTSKKLESVKSRYREECYKHYKLNESENEADEN